MKRQLGVTNLFFPIPAALIVCGDQDYSNAVTVAWIGMVDSATVGIGLLKGSYSLGIIRDKGKFTVNIPPADLVKEVDYCGMVSGRNTDKFADTNLTPIKDTLTGVPIIKECPLNIECELIKDLELDNLVLLLGKIVGTHVDEDKVEMLDGKPKVDAAKMNPIVFFAVIDEYWSIGDKLGDAFSVGKVLMDRA
jgi:flavin reductase (DIM6/NTAB) family NADH-FMN oxidoreductase RutF